METRSIAETSKSGEGLAGDFTASNHHDSAVSEHERVEFSVIVTSFREEQSIDEFVERLLATMRSLGRSFEVILVNDGSTDQTFERQMDLFHRHAEIAEALDLFRNSGQVCAMSCGVAHSQGSHFVFIDSDLQLDPEDLPKLVAEFDQGFDIVSGVRRNRKDPTHRLVASWIANVVMRKVSRHELTDFGCTFKIYRGELVRAFGFGPTKPWKTAFVFAQAERVKEVPINHHPRRYGKSGWTLSKLSSFLFDHVVGLSSRPFQWLSLISVGFGALILLRIAVSWLLPGHFLTEVSNGLLLNVIALNIFVALAGLSAVGEFTFRIYSKSERDPIYVIRRRLSRHAPPNIVASSDGS
jgi:glycosyltransferase involved in cell wall biosynthesis